MTKQQQEQIDGILNSGKIVFIGEYRGGKGEQISYVSKKTGQKAHFNRLVHNLERGEGTNCEPIAVSTPLADDVDPQAVPLPFTKGQRVLVVCTGLEVKMGVTTARAEQLLAIA